MASDQTYTLDDLYNLQAVASVKFVEMKIYRENYVPVETRRVKCISPFMRHWESLRFTI